MSKGVSIATSNTFYIRKRQIHIIIYTWWRKTSTDTNTDTLYLTQFVYIFQLHFLSVTLCIALWGMSLFYCLHFVYELFGGNSCHSPLKFDSLTPLCFSGEHGHVITRDVLPHAIWRHQHSGELPPSCGPAVAARSHFCPLLRKPLYLHHRTHGWDQPKSTNWNVAMWVCENPY